MMEYKIFGYELGISYFNFDINCNDKSLSIKEWEKIIISNAEKFINKNFNISDTQDKINTIERSLKIWAIDTSINDNEFKVKYDYNHIKNFHKVPDLFLKVELGLKLSELKQLKQEVIQAKKDKRIKDKNISIVCRKNLETLYKKEKRYYQNKLIEAENQKKKLNENFEDTTQITHDIQLLKRKLKELKAPQIRAIELMNENKIATYTEKKPNPKQENYTYTFKIYNSLK